MIRVLGVVLIAGNIIAAMVLLLIPVPVQDSREVKQQIVRSPTASTTSATTATSAVEEVSVPVRASRTPEASVATTGVSLPDALTNGVRVPVHTSGTVLAAMRAYADTTSSFTFAGVEYPGMGFFVTEINGISQGEGSYWMLYRNGNPVNCGAAECWVEPGEVVEWRLEKGYY
jgi:Domain of unknown function (DUF4430)